MIADMHKTGEVGGILLVSLILYYVPGELGKELRKIGIHSKLAERQELLQLGMRTAVLERHKSYRKN